jgi:hypothetical protein
MVTSHTMARLVNGGKLREDHGRTDTTRFPIARIDVVTREIKKKKDPTGGHPLPRTRDAPCG